jgi:baculoviral IAP repeat-containing protein 6
MLCSKRVLDVTANVLLVLFFLVLDMARHVPLYQAVLEVMRALATCPSLVHLLAPYDGNGSSDVTTSLAALIGKMKQCVDTYSKTLR